MTETLQSSARIANRSDIFGELGKSHVNLAIWKREPIPGINELVSSPLKDIRFTATLAGFEQPLADEMHDSGYPDLPQRDDLIQDACDLAGHYCAALGLDVFEVRLETVTTDSCRKFHGDYVSARLITTYVGTGTQWIEADDVARVREGLEPQTIHTLEAGDVGLFKGKLGTDDPAIHRSPPIAGTGEIRLLLVLNPVSKD